MDRIRVDAMRELCYQVLAFRGASRRDRLTTARRQKVMADLESEPPDIVKGWDAGEPTAWEIVNAWVLEVIAALYEPTGNIPEGKLFHNKLESEMCKYKHV